MKLDAPLADRSRWSTTGHCPIEKAMALIGSRNTMLIMREAFYGTTRYDDFVQRVEMSPATAASNLKALASAGLLTRQPYQEPGGRTRDEYVLTEAGAELFAIIVGLYQWGSRHAGTAALDLVHLDCGQPVDAHVRCTRGHDVTSDDVELRRTRMRKHR